MVVHKQIREAGYYTAYFRSPVRDNHWIHADDTKVFYIYTKDGYESIWNKVSAHQQSTVPAHVTVITKSGTKSRGIFGLRSILNVSIWFIAEIET